MRFTTCGRHIGAVVCVLLAFITVSSGSGANAAETAWEALKTPGHIAIVRHAEAPGVGDPNNFELGDCSTQRTLNEAGRAQARAIGQAMRDAGVEIDRVLTSQWCRARNTAKLMDLRPVEDMPALNSFFRNRQSEDAQLDKIRAFLADLPEDERVVMVTHQVNITALTKAFTREGEILILDPADDGSVEVVDSVHIPPPET